MNKKIIKTMLELEHILNDYLANNKPLVLLEEEYSLTPKQRGFYINRVLSYEGNYDKIKEKLGDIESVEPGEEYLFMSHFIEEKFPLEHEKQIAYFKRLEYLKEKLAFTSLENEVYERDFKIVEYRKELKKFNLNEIKLVQAINLEIDDEDAEYEQDNREENILAKYNLTEDQYENLNEQLESYNYIISKINGRKNELKLQNANNDYEKLREEYENIRTELIHRNIKLANWVVRRFFKYIPFEMEDVQGYALEGLVKAINEFDYKIGGHFSTFATIVIRRKITRHFKELVGMTWNNYLKCIKYDQYVEQYKMIDPSKEHVTVEDIYNSGISGLSYNELKKIDSILVRNILPNTYAYPVDPLDLRSKDNDSLKTFEDYEEEDEYIDNVESPVIDDEGMFSIDDPSMLAESRAVKEYARKDIFEAIKTLTEQEKKVLIMSFGLCGNEPMTLRKIAAEFNLSAERIRQIESKALRKLRTPKHRRKLEEYIVDNTPDTKTNRKSLGEYLTDLLYYEITRGASPVNLEDIYFRSTFNLPYDKNPDIIKEKYISACKSVAKYKHFEDIEKIQTVVSYEINTRIPIEFITRYLEYQKEKNPMKL